MAKTPIGNSDETVAPAIIEPGKGRPTPTRREREAANMRPLVQSDRKAANKVARAKMAEARDRARIGMAAGEEKYLTARDRGPQRRYVRDFVDARFSVGEILLPVMFLFVVATLIPGIEAYSFLVVWIFFVVAVLDAVFLGFQVTKRLAAKFGKDNVQKGTRWYAAMRAIQLRPMRLPKPRVKRGAYPA